MKINEETFDLLEVGARILRKDSQEVYKEALEAHASVFVDTIKMFDKVAIFKKGSSEN